MATDMKQSKIWRVAGNSADHKTSAKPQRIQLNQHDVFRLPSLSRQISVISGAIWIVQEKRDFILESGATFSLQPGQFDPAVIPMNHAPAEFEIE
jgi:hypothetical protein